MPQHTAPPASADDEPRPEAVPLQDQPTGLDDPIPRVCTIADVCRILRMSESQFYNLRSQGRFPIPEMDPPIDNKPRFSGHTVKAYLDGVKTPKRRRG